MAQSGLALTLEQTIEIVSMYSSSDRSISAVATAPGWYVVGGFPLDVSVRARIDLLALVSDVSLVLTARLYCVTPGFEGEVPNTRVAVTSMIDTRVLSGYADLTGGRVYQMQAQVVGNAGADYYGIVRRGAPTG